VCRRGSDEYPEERKDGERSPCFHACGVNIILTRKMEVIQTSLEQVSKD